MSGQVLVASRLSQHLEVRLLTHKSGGKDDKLGVLSAEGTLPSYVTEHEDVRAVRVRLLGLKTTWSQDVTVTGEKTKENRLVKVQCQNTPGIIQGSYGARKLGKSGNLTSVPPEPGQDLPEILSVNWEKSGNLINRSDFVIPLPGV